MIKFMIFVALLALAAIAFADKVGKEEKSEIMETASAHSFAHPFGHGVGPIGYAAFAHGPGFGYGPGLSHNPGFAYGPGRFYGAGYGVDPRFAFGGYGHALPLPVRAGYGHFGF